MGDRRGGREQKEGEEGEGREKGLKLSFIADKIDFFRDIVAYMCAVALVIGVAYDGEVSCYDNIVCFLHCRVT